MDARELLGACGLAATPNRLCVLRALEGARRPQTPQELLAALPALGASMNRVTLYRILELLVERGVAKSSSSRSGARVRANSRR